ncbi:MAG: DUF4416 family protein [candidate division Zixibacteria bacterium]|nr:DUF4416 family protein [candidate division Zixibacteria bacterium]
MGKERDAEPVKLICGLLYRDSDTYESAINKLESMYGTIEFESEHTEFVHSTYYKKEMGEGLIRTFISFSEAVSPERLSSMKRATNKLEQSFLDENNGRKINIDPGYVSLANLVLASTKDFSHRIYLEHGIYAEITLLYENKRFTSLKWTYPDYQTDLTFDFLLRVRESLKDFILEHREKQK